MKLKITEQQLHSINEFLAEKKAFFKYWDWLIGLIEDGLFIDLTSLKHYLPLPVAISFYTFESLSYIIDIYRKQFKPTKNFLDYLKMLK